MRIDSRCKGAQPPQSMWILWGKLCGYVDNFVYSPPIGGESRGGHVDNPAGSIPQGAVGSAPLRSQLLGLGGLCCGVGGALPQKAPLCKGSWRGLKPRLRGCKRNSSIKALVKPSRLQSPSPLRGQPPLHKVAFWHFPFTKLTPQFTMVALRLARRPFLALLCSLGFRRRKRPSPLPQTCLYRQTIPLHLKCTKGGEKEEGSLCEGKGNERQFLISAGQSSFRHNPSRTPVYTKGPCG